MRPQASASPGPASRMCRSVAVSMTPALRCRAAMGIPSSRGVRFRGLMNSTHEAVLRDLARLALRAPSRAEFFDEAAARLQRVLPHDGACWHTLDPGSDLVTEHRLQNIPDRFPLIAHNEYQVDDVNKFVDLARAPRRAASLHEATGGRLERRPPHPDVFAAGGIGAELRGAFVADGATWGAVIMIRMAGQREF